MLSAGFSITFLKACNEASDDRGILWKIYFATFWLNLFFTKSWQSKHIKANPFLYLRTVNKK